MRDRAVTLHRDELPPGDVLQRIGFRVTNPTRSIIDVASLASDEEQLGRAIAEAGERGMVSIRTLRSRAEAVDVGAALYIERAISMRTAS